MSQPAGEGGPADGGQPLPEKAALTKVSGASSRQGWTKVSCPCCVSEDIEPLVLVKLGQKVGPETKRWLIRLIGAPQKDGGEIFGLASGNRRFMITCFLLSLFKWNKRLIHQSCTTFD
ncbi:unnamed protein product [Tetraodon nigroviridis]|uniref:(spotted green pufferfish) hypothetical protein n=1 Tax=Tetraodon nigroviridis TaxID=99883 RepID=Q4SPC6_TETNG|nr:unnamed protein product [Tetraodon nigroviridis]